MIDKLTELQTFLRENPELKPYQEYLETTLNKANTQQERIDILTFFIQENLQRLQKELESLCNLIRIAND